MVLLLLAAAVVGLPLALIVWTAAMLRPTWPRLMGWALPFAVVVGGVWGWLSWAELREHDAECRSEWVSNQSAFDDAGWRPGTMSDFMATCRTTREAEEDAARADPDAGCKITEDTSGCPEYDLRPWWLSFAEVVAGLGLLCCGGFWVADRRLVHSPL